MANTATIKKAKRRIKRPAQLQLFLAGLWNTGESPGKEKAIYLSDKANTLASCDSTKICTSSKDCILLRRDVLQLKPIFTNIQAN